MHVARLPKVRKSDKKRAKASLDCVQTTGSFILCFQRERHADEHPAAAQ